MANKGSTQSADGWQAAIAPRADPRSGPARSDTLRGLEIAQRLISKGSASALSPRLRPGQGGPRSPSAIGEAGEGGRRLHYVFLLSDPGYAAVRGTDSIDTDATKSASVFPLGLRPNQHGDDRRAGARRPIRVVGCALATRGRG